MKRRTFVAGAAALAGCSAIPWRQAIAGHVDEGKPRYGGTLRVAFASDIHSGRFTLNREHPPGYETFWVWNNTHNALVTLGPNYEIVPDLAKSWEIIDKGKEYVFHLHENVKFHDGTACDAEAVKWNFDDMLSRGLKAWVGVYFTQMESTQVLDRYTFKVIMKEPAALLPVLAGYFHGIPIASPTAVQKYGNEWNRHPVGTGAFTYKLENYRPDELIVLEKNPDYFKKGLPYLDRVEIKVIKDPMAAMTAIRTGQIDILERISPQHVPIMEKARGVKVMTAPERMPLVCFMNMRKPPFNDVRVRQAIGGYGLNRKEIAETVFQNRATPTVSVLSPGVEDYLDLNETYPYDPARAKALLKEAGYDASTPLEFEVVTNNDAAFFADVATLLKSQMERIGVKVNLVMMDKPAWLDRITNKQDFQMTVEDFAALVDINQRSLAFFRDAKANYAGFNHPELEEMVLQWRREVDPAKRRELSHAMQRFVAKDMLWCNITGSPYFQVARDHVKGYHFMNQLYVFWETTWMDKKA
jgi:ABC-type transport system substrate-binding protein